MCAAPWQTAQRGQRFLSLVTTNRGFSLCCAYLLIGSSTHSSLRDGSFSAAAITSADPQNLRTDSRAVANNSSLEWAIVFLATDDRTSPSCSPLTSASTVTPSGAGVKLIPTTTGSTAL